MKTLPNLHPGDVLLEEFLMPLGISQNALARAAGVPPRRINEIVPGKRSVSADSAIRLAAALGTSERFWGRLTMTWNSHGAHWARRRARSRASRRSPRRCVTAVAMADGDGARRPTTLT